MDRDDVRRRGDDRDRRQVPRLVALVTVEGFVDRGRCRRDQDRVPVRLRLADRARREIAAGAASVLDDDGLAELAADILSDDARNGVGDPARRISDNEGDRPDRVLLGRGSRAAERREDEAGQQCR